MAAIHDPKRPPHFLAMDQSEGTHRRHLAQFGVRFTNEDFAEKAKAARVMLATTPGLGKYFGGAIVHNDFFALTTPDGTPLQRVLEDQGVLVIGKFLDIDKETGLATKFEELPAAMQRLTEIGVHMIKTRTTAKVDLPQYVDSAADQMVEVQRLAARNGKIFPVLEPEFDVENPGSLRENEALMIRLLGGMMERMRKEGLEKHPFVVKTSFPTPGKGNDERMDPKASAAAFLRICEQAQLPEDLLIVFLSGGHSPENSRRLLQAMAQVRRNVGSSFSRANLEQPYRMTLSGLQPDIAAGQHSVLLEGRKNALAMEGRYLPGLEIASDMAMLESLVQGNPRKADR